MVNVTQASLMLGIHLCKFKWKESFIIWVSNEWKVNKFVVRIKLTEFMVSMWGSDHFWTCLIFKETWNKEELRSLLSETEDIQRDKVNQNKPVEEWYEDLD